MNNRVILRPPPGHTFKIRILFRFRWHLAFPHSDLTLNEMMEEGGVQVNHMNRNFKATFESIFRSMLPDADLLGKTFYLLLTDFLFVPSVSEDVDSTLVGFLGEHDAFRVRSLMDAQENLYR